MIRRSVGRLMAALLIAALPLPAAASLIQIDATTTVTISDLAGYSVGDAVQVTYVYDTGGTLSSSTATTAIYDAIISFSITIDGDIFTATPGPDTILFVYDDNLFPIPPVLVDGFTAESVAVTGPGSPIFMSFGVATTVTSTLGSTAIPSISAVNSVIASSNLNGGQVFFNTGTVSFAPCCSTIVAQVLPEPGVAPLAVGATALLARRFRSRRRRVPRPCTGA